MAFTLDTSLAFTIKDGTTTIGYLTDSVSSESHDEVNTGMMEVTTGTSDATISLGGLTTVEALAIWSDFQVSIKVNAQTTAAAGKAFYYRDAAITALTVSNSSGSTAKIRYAMVGT